MKVPQWFQKLYWRGDTARLHAGRNGLPKRFQGLLWSKPIGKLDLENDKVYIIHQILSFGSFEDIRLLFRLYPKEEIRSIFTNYPKRVYRAPVFSFVKNFILGFRTDSLDSQQYVRASLGNN